MAHKFKKGDSIFFLFKKGETVQDSQCKPRYYLDRTKAELYLPYGDEIVEYAPERHGRWVNGICTACNFDMRELTDGENDLEQWMWDEGFDYCPNCGAKMDGDA